MSPSHVMFDVDDPASTGAAAAPQLPCDAFRCPMIDLFEGGIALLAPMRDAGGTLVDARFTWISDAGASSFRQSPHDLVGQTLGGLFPASRRDEMVRALGVVIDGGQPFQREFILDGNADVHGLPSQQHYTIRAAPCGDGAAVSWREITRGSRINQEREWLCGETERLAVESEAIFSCQADPFFIFDTQERVVRANAAARELLGIDPQHAGVDVLRQLYSVCSQNGQPLPETMLPLRRALQGETVQGERCLIRMASGTEMVMQVMAAPLMVGGEIAGAIIALHDVTERERLLRDARQRAAVLDATLSSIADGMIIYDQDGRIAMMNEAARVLLGYSSEAMAMTYDERVQSLRFIDQIVPQFDPDDTPFHRAMRGETVCGLTVSLQRNGRTHWVITSAAPINLGDEIMGVAAIFTDITAQKQAEKSLRQSEETARALLNATTDAAYLLDINGVILAANEPLATRFGLPVASLLGHNISEFLTPDALATRQRYLAQVIASGCGARFEDQHRERWLDTSLSPVFDEQGRVVQLAVFSRDITEQKRTETALNRLAYFDQLTGLPNRLLFHDRLTQSLALLHRQPDRHLAVAFVDLDCFKEVNDTLGHQAGDVLLQQVAGRLTASLRDGDTVARLGGDEFVLILTNLTHPAHDISVTLQRVLASLHAPCPLPDHTVEISASIGVALAPDDGKTVDELMKNADIAMYRAKERGRDRYHLYSMA